MARLVAAFGCSHSTMLFIPGSELHRLPIEDQDVALIPFPEWAPYLDEITDVLARFMARVEQTKR
ncbi:MAG: hypothetical protein IT537_21270 [Hyphomicrobiales bacterium]|nr:hypothetical protein [Hyphomicrobiales bacterium]